MILTVACLLVSGVAANEGTNIFVSAHKNLLPSSQPIYSSSFKQQQLNSRRGRCNERKFTHWNSRSYSNSNSNTIVPVTVPVTFSRV